MWQRKEAQKKLKHAITFRAYAYRLDRPNSIELSPCDFQPLRFLPRFASLSLLTGGVFANILTISVKPLSSFDGFAFWSFSDLL